MSSVPCAPYIVASCKLTPSMPKAPRLAGVSAPFAATPVFLAGPAAPTGVTALPTAGAEDALGPPIECPAPNGAPPIAGAELRLPGSPATSDPPSNGAATASTTPLNAISSPPFGKALSNTNPNLDSASLVLAWESVTCPISFAPRRSNTLPFAFTSCVSLASTGSPDLAFFASSPLESSAWRVIPVPNPPAGSAVVCAVGPVPAIARPLADPMALNESTPAARTAIQYFRDVMVWITPQLL